MPRTILLADDSVTVRKVVELTFCETDIRVESVASGADALARLRDLTPDLVLADVVMPEPTGYDICRTVKASGRPVPVLLLAGTFEPFDAERARSCGADGHIVKPFDSRALLERVETLLERGATEATSAEAEPAVRDPGSRDADLAALLEDLDAGAPPEEAPSPSPEPQEPSPAAEASDERAILPVGLTDADVDRVARRVVEILADRVVREIAWDVVPELAEILVRERLRQLEREETEAS